MGTILSRIQDIANNEHITISAMEKSIGASKGVLSRAIANGTDIQSKWIQILVDNYPIYSTDWLLTGRGEMLKSDATKRREETIDASVSLIPTIGKPYYDVDFLGGFDDVFNDQTSIPMHNIIIQGFERVQLWCNVSGHSMEPQINHGDIIGLRECTVNDIQYGEVYAVVLDSLRTIKKIRKASDPEMLRYIPINTEDFDEQEFAINRIIKVYEVIGSISKFF
ncbi:S24 family peptidase [Alloprevotella tannerae]|uniref:S24 family peptidase n=1 Tax=Alloprevotella tannerae TaxID=76122 RepID=UPI00288C1419|nr:S24 family peptidase [Alloprevotella tannerae]